MNKFFLLFIVAFLVNFSIAQSGKFKNNYYAKSYAMVVGINNYQSSEWQKLDTAQKGAKAVADMLADHGFIVSTLYDEQATKNQILQTMNAIVAKMQKEDRFLFYFAGHGHKKGTDGYLVPQNGSDFDSYVPLSELIKISKNISAKHQLFILDACYAGFIKMRSGTFGSPKKKDPAYLKNVTLPDSRWALTSGGENQRVLDSGGPNNHSPFTGYFLLSIKEGRADGNSDGFITLPEIYNYLLPKTTIEDLQSPQMTPLPGDKEGLFVFVSEKPGTAEYDQIKVGGKARAHTKKTIGNPEFKNDRAHYTENLSASDWLDRGDDSESITYAIECYTNAINLYPMFDEAYFNRAIAYEDSADYEIELLGDEEEYPEHIKGLFTKAIDDYKKVLEFYPDDIDCYFNLGALYYELKRYNEALVAFNQNLQLDPEDTYALAFRGDVYLAQDRIDLAFGDYNEALSIDPEDGYLYYARAEGHYFLREYEDAIYDYTSAIKLISDEPDFYFARADAYEGIDEFDKADKDRKKAEKLEKKNKY